MRIDKRERVTLGWIGRRVRGGGGRGAMEGEGWRGERDGGRELEGEGWGRRDGGRGAMEENSDRGRGAMEGEERWKGRSVGGRGAFEGEERLKGRSN